MIWLFLQGIFEEVLWGFLGIWWTCNFSFMLETFIEPFSPVDKIKLLSELMSIDLIFSLWTFSRWWTGEDLYSWILQTFIDISCEVEIREDLSGLIRSELIISTQCKVGNHPRRTIYYQNGHLWSDRFLCTCQDYALLSKYLLKRKESFHHVSMLRQWLDLDSGDKDLLLMR